jgi:hypothetical protein
LYTSLVLKALGCATGHEQVFDPPLRHPPAFGEWHGDVSWAAVPVLEELPPGTVVLHQVREPSAVISSVNDFGLVTGRLGLSLRHDILRAVASLVEAQRRAFGADIPRRPSSVLSYKRMMRSFCPEIWEAGDPLCRAARYWVTWNQAAERAASLDHLHYRRFRVEDLDGRLLSELMALIGHEADPTACAAALAAIPRDTNRRRSPEPFRLSSLDADEARSVGRLAERYGYVT